AQLAAGYRAVRRATERLSAPLQPEDYILQSMTEASPAKWHLAHTTWFFEQFVLAGAEAGYRPFRPQYNYLFNSYYEAVGPRHPRPERRLLSRPGIGEVYRYRAAVDERVERFLRQIGGEKLHEVAPVLTLGLHHEQQHQELILTDIQHALSLNPLRPAYTESPRTGATVTTAAGLTWTELPAGLRWIGPPGEGFPFGNEAP